MSSTPLIPSFGLGTFRLTGQPVVDSVRSALELGYRAIDTAQIYGPLTNELLIGRAIQGHRDEYVVATKFSRRMDDAVAGDMSSVGPQDGSAAHVRKSIEGSLERLGTDRGDLLHRLRRGLAVPQVVEADARAAPREPLADGAADAARAAGHEGVFSTEIDG